MGDCPKCGSAFEGQAGLCTQCGSDRPDGSGPPNWRSLVAVAVIVQLLYWPLNGLLERMWGNYSHSLLALAAYGAALFLPGAILSGNGKRLLGMAALGAYAAVVLNWGISWLQIPPDRLIINQIAWPGGLLMLAGVGYWLLAPGDSWRTLGWTLAVCVSVAAVYAVLDFLVRHSLVLEVIPRSAMAAALAVAAWLAVPLGWRLAQHPGRWTRGSMLLTVSLGGYALLLQLGVFTLAEYSVQGRGPFTRHSGVQLLWLRGRDADFEWMARQLHQVDWGPSYGDLPALARDEDWRGTAVRAMLAHDASWAVQRLSDLLLEQPSPELVVMCEDAFVSHRRYETVPILMRYALLESVQVSPFNTIGKHRHKEALEALEVPQVVVAWLLTCSTEQRLFQALEADENPGGVPPQPAEPVIYEHLRPRLAALLGEDAGHPIADWEELYQQRIEQAPTPLSQAQREETDRVIACFSRYQSARQDWFRRRAELQRQGSARLPYPGEPNWNVPGTDALEREVNEYVERVEQILSGTGAGT